MLSSTMSADANNHVQIVMAATTYLGVGQPESALRVLHSNHHL